MGTIRIYRSVPLIRERYESSCLQLPKHSTQNSWYRIESTYTVCGHHIYKASWSPYIGEELPVQREVNNIHDDFTVAVSSTTAVLSVMYHRKFPEPAGTSCTRVAARWLVRVKLPYAGTLAVKNRGAYFRRGRISRKLRYSQMHPVRLVGMLIRVNLTVYRKLRGKMGMGTLSWDCGTNLCILDEVKWSDVIGCSCSSQVPHN